MYFLYIFFLSVKLFWYFVLSMCHVIFTYTPPPPPTPPHTDTTFFQVWNGHKRSVSCFSSCGYCAVNICISFPVKVVCYNFSCHFFSSVIQLFLCHVLSSAATSGRCLQIFINQISSFSIRSVMIYDLKKHFWISFSPSYIEEIFDIFCYISFFVLLRQFVI